MDILETKYLYFSLLAFTLSYPLAQSFEWRLKYYKKWSALLKGIVVMMFLFIPWDVWFASQGVWWFHEDYIVGIRLFHLPIEEWLFFLLVPFACLFIYEVLIYYIKRDLLKNVARKFFILVGILLVVCSLIFYKQLYTVVTFSLTGISLLVAAYFNPKWLGQFLLMYFVSWIPFLLVNGILTGSFTMHPVVNYNPSEIIGLRLFTIPIEDSIYNLLMLLIVVSVYNWDLSKKEIER